MSLFRRSSAAPRLDLARTQARLAALRAAKTGAPLRDAGEFLSDPGLYVLACARLLTRPGALVRGADGATGDGATLDGLIQLATDVHAGTHTWAPVRRVTIEKSSGGVRPLGMLVWHDRVVQEVIRLLLDAIYEPSFCDASHGFRPGRGVHTAVAQIRDGWRGVRWFAEADIATCFDSIDHAALLDVLRERVRDERLLALIAGSLRAGVLSGGRWSRTLAGIPQGSSLSPLLANIYLDRLDRFVLTHLRGSTGGHGARRGWRSTRLFYVRYADDFLLGVSGARSFAEDVLAEVKDFLSEELALSLAPAKTGVVDAAQGVRFLGHDLVVAPEAGGMEPRLPVELLEERCERYRSSGRPAVLPELVHLTPGQIIGFYTAEYRSCRALYRNTVNLHAVERLRTVMELSLLETLAIALGTNVEGVLQRCRATIQTPQGSRTVVRWRTRNHTTEWGNDPPVCAAPSRPKAGAEWGTLPARILAARCERCSTDGPTEVHRDTHPSNGPQPKPSIVLLCAGCHRTAHHSPKPAGHTRSPIRSRVSR